MTGLFLPGFEVWRESASADGTGGHVRSFALSATVAGRLSPLGGSEQIRADQERGVISLRFSTPASTDVREGDQVRKGLRTVTVHAVRVTSSGRRKECVCEEVR